MSLRNILQGANSTTIKDKLDEFVRNGGDINAQFGRNKDTYLMFYIVSNNVDIATILVEYPNINVNIRDTTGSTALNLAVNEPDMLPVIKLLIGRGANIDNADTMGETPLMLATLSDNKEIVEFLVDSGADKTLKNKRGQTAYDIAKEENNARLYSLLRLEGVDGSISNISSINSSSSSSSNNSNNNNSNNNNSNNRGPRWQRQARPPAWNANNGANNAANFIDGIEPRRNPIPEDSNIIIENTIEVFDLEAGDYVSVTYDDTLFDNQNIYFKASETYFRLPREAIIASIHDYSNIQFECKKFLKGAPKRENVEFDRPYYLIRSIGNYLVPLDEVLGILRATEENSYILKEVADKKKLKYVSSFKSIIRDYSGIGLNGVPVNISSRDHCQEGTSREVFELLPFFFKKGVATKGGASRRKRRATKKLKRGRPSNTRRKAKK